MISSRNVMVGACAEPSHTGRCPVCRAAVETDHEEALAIAHAIERLHVADAIQSWDPDATWPPAEECR